MVVAHPADEHPEFHSASDAATGIQAGQSVLLLPLRSRSSGHAGVSVGSVQRSPRSSTPSRMRDTDSPARDRDRDHGDASTGRLLGVLSIVVRSTSAGVPAPALSPTDIAIATDLAAHLATWCEVRHALRRSQTTSRAARQAAAYEQLLVVLAEAAGSVREWAWGLPPRPYHAAGDADRASEGSSLSGSVHDFGGAHDDVASSVSSASAPRRRATSRLVGAAVPTLSSPAAIVRFLEGVAAAYFGVQAATVSLVSTDAAAADAASGGRSLFTVRTPKGADTRHVGFRIDRRGSAGGGVDALSPAAASQGGWVLAGVAPAMRRQARWCVQHEGVPLRVHEEDTSAHAHQHHQRRRRAGEHGPVSPERSRKNLARLRGVDHPASAVSAACTVPPSPFADSDVAEVCVAVWAVTVWAVAVCACLCVCVRALRARGRVVCPCRCVQCVTRVWLTRADLGESPRPLCCRRAAGQPHPRRLGVTPGR